jgi:DNA-binding transcriptional MerR regulator
MASKLSGVGVHTIRAWEKRYMALVPARDTSGHRTYSKTDIEKLMLLSELCLIGYTISKVARFNIEELKALLIDLGKSAESLMVNDFNLVSETTKAIDIDKVMPLLIFALKNFKLDIVNLELNKLRDQVSKKELVFKILLPLYYTSLELQKNHSVSMQQFDTIMTLLTSHSFHLLYTKCKGFDESERSHIHILLTGIKGELQSFELNLVGLLVQHYNHHLTYLGVNHQLETVLDLSHTLNVNILFIIPSQISQVRSEMSQHILDKISLKIHPECEYVFASNVELNINLLKSKKFYQLKNFEAIDDFLSKKIV